MTREEATLLDGLRIVSQQFWGPDPEICAEMVRETYLRRIMALNEVLNSDKAAEDLHQITSILNCFPDTSSLYQYMEEGYVRLFISAREGIVAPLYESCYEFENAPLMGKPAIEMRERFDAVGLSIAENIQEPPDHISIELEYLYFLLEKGWAEEDKTVIAEGMSFACDIMLPWVSNFQKRLAAEEECRFYPLIGKILMEILDTIGRFREMD
jgi:TorA-specific chaperone